jgi:hypothetical protein
MGTGFPIRSAVETRELEPGFDSIKTGNALETEQTSGGAFK